jgi:glycosyltransferase involved in cell wall biosynthesis
MENVHTVCHERSIVLAMNLHRVVLMSDSTTTTAADSADRRLTAPLDLSRAGVIVHANLEGESECAAENRALALRLLQHQFPIQVAPLQGQQLQSYSPSLRMLGRNLKLLLNDRLELAESVLYQSGAPTSWNLDFYGRCRVGRTAFGTDRIPDGWADRCNSLDELWLPSKFHAETFAASGVERSKIRVVPTAVDTEVFRPGRASAQLRSVPAKSFRFVAIADRWLASGIDILVRAFIQEFSPEEDVALVIHCPLARCGDSFVDFEAEVIALIEANLGKNLENVPNIALLMGSLSGEDRGGLFVACHAFVQPARGESTGRHCLEALACQLPIIATDWGPLNDFLTVQNSFTVTTDGLVPAQPEEDELFAGHRWAEPNVDHLRHQMREVFENSEEAALRAERGRREVIGRFEWNAVLPEWIRNFRRLLD